MAAEQQQGGQGKVGQGVVSAVSKEPIRRQIVGWISRTVQRGRYVLIGLLVLGAAALVAYVTYSEINKSRAAASAVLAEAAQDA